MPHTLGNRIAAVAIRDQMPIPPLIDMQETGMKTIEEVKEDITKFLEKKNIETLLVTCEHFSYFRETNEIKRLLYCLPEACDFEVYLVTRDLEEYRISYLEHAKTTGHGPSSNPHSPYYFEKDSWLLDDQALVQCWQAEFSNLQIITYERSRMIYKLGQAMNLPSNLINKEFKINTNAPHSKRLKNIIRDALKKFPLGKYSLRQFRKWKWGA